jgi:hypothetical protein
MYEITEEVKLLQEGNKHKICAHENFSEIRRRSLLEYNTVQPDRHFFIFWNDLLPASSDYREYSVICTVNGTRTVNLAYYPITYILNLATLQTQCFI